MLIFAAYCAVGALVLFLPGLVVGLAGGLRGFVCWALAPAITIGLLGVGAIVLDKAGVPYSPLSMGAFIGVVAVVFALVSLLTGWLRPAWNAIDRQRLPWSENLWILIIFGITALAWTRYLHNIIPKTDVVNQGFDNLFHSNAVQWIVQHHNASSFAIERMTAGPRPPIFYPAAWHDFVAMLLMILPRADVSMAVNAATYVQLLLAWPLGLLLLVRALLPKSRAALAGAGILSIALPAFPLRTLDWGPLFPNTLAWILTPPFLALVIAACGTGWGRLRVPLLRALLTAPVAFAGIALSHPNQVPVVLIYLLPILVLWWRHAATAPRESPRQRVARVRLVLIVLTFLAFVVSWIKIRPLYDLWTAVSLGNLDLALLSWLDMAGSTPETPALVAATLIIVGIVVALRRRILRWWLVIYCVWAALFMYNYTHNPSQIRYWLTGIWYSDHTRLAALVALAAIPLGCLGLDALINALAPWWDNLVRGPVGARLGSNVQRWLVRPSSSVVAASLLIAFIGMCAVESGGFRITARGAMLQYSTLYNGTMLDDAKRQMLRELPQYVPRDQKIATNPFNGSSMAYATTGIETTTTHALYTPTADELLLESSLKDAYRNPRVCTVLRRNNIHWVLDFGYGHLDGGHPLWEGFKNLDRSAGFVPVYHMDHYTLYRIDACWS